MFTEWIIHREINKNKLNSLYAAQGYFIEWTKVTRIELWNLIGSKREAIAHNFLLFLFLFLVEMNAYASPWLHVYTSTSPYRFIWWNWCTYLPRRFISVKIHMNFNNVVSTIWISYTILYYYLFAAQNSWSTPVISTPGKNNLKNTKKKND